MSRAKDMSELAVVGAPSVAVFGGRLRWRSTARLGALALLCGCYQAPPRDEFAYATPEERADAELLLTDSDATGSPDVDTTDDANDALVADADTALDGDVDDVPVGADADAVTADVSDAKLDTDASAPTDAGPTTVTGFRLRSVAVMVPRTAGQPWGVGGGDWVAGTSKSTAYETVLGATAWLWQWAK